MRKFIKRIRFLLKIHKSLPFLYDFFRSKEVTIGKKFISAGFFVFYFFLPTDLIPDFLLFFGLVDDVSLFVFILQLIVKMAPPSLVDKYELERM